MPKTVLHHKMTHRCNPSFSGVLKHFAINLQKKTHFGPKRNDLRKKLRITWKFFFLNKV